jgi:rhamnogalacturonyl hydrolase YesR
VADKVVRETDFTLRDRATKAAVPSSKELPPDADVYLPSRWTQWYYTSYLAGEGLRLVGEQLKDNGYLTFQQRQLDLFLEHADFFRRKREHTGKTPSGADDMRFYFDVDIMWTQGFAGPFITRFFAAKDPRMTGYVDRFRKMIATLPRDDDRIMLYVRSVFSDALCLVEPGMSALANAGGERAYADDLVQQVVGGHRRLFNPEKGLHHHSWDTRTGKYDGDFWGRGAGWMTMGLANALWHLPADHPRRTELLAAFRQTMAGLLRWQTADGGWRQLLDDAEAWVETSCTAMFTYSMALGVNEGWLDETYRAAALKGWAALVSRAKPNGVLLDICPGTGQGDRAHYLGRPRKADDPHGYGPFLMAGAQVLRLHAANR